MDTNVRNAALRAARKLAFGAMALGFAAGCGGQTDEGTRYEGAGNEDDPEGAEGAAADCDAATPPEHPDGVACSTRFELPPMGEIAPPLDADAVRCCGGHLASVVATAGNAAPEHDAALVNCCTALIADSMTRAPVFAFQDAPGRDLCCFGNVVASSDELFGYPLCSPWGPPVPPSMDFLLEVA